MILYEAEAKIKLPEQNDMAHIFTLYQIASSKTNYDKIVGQGLLQELDIKFINKKYIFSKVKLITDPLQLEDYEKKSSIGYQFQLVSHQNHKNPIDDVKAIWHSAKKMLYSAMKEKRNSVQNSIKLVWERAYHVYIINYSKYACNCYIVILIQLSQVHINNETIMCI